MQGRFLKRTYGLLKKNIWKHYYIHALTFRMDKKIHEGIALLITWIFLFGSRLIFQRDFYFYFAQSNLLLKKCVHFLLFLAYAVTETIKTYAKEGKEDFISIQCLGKSLTTHIPENAHFLKDKLYWFFPTQLDIWHPSSIHHIVVGTDVDFRVGSDQTSFVQTKLEQNGIQYGYVYYIMLVCDDCRVCVSYNVANNKKEVVTKLGI